MSAVMERPRLAEARPAAARKRFLSGRTDRVSGIALSLALHAALFFVGGFLWVKPAAYGVTAGQAAVEIELVAAPRAPQEPPQTAPPDAAQAASVPPVSESAVPEALVREADPVVEDPAPAMPASAVTGPSGDGSSPIPGEDEVTRRSTGAQVVARPNYLRNPAPRYPEASRRNNEEGLVLLTVVVNPSGRPQTVELAGSSGFARLDRAALEAVKRWDFEPARLGSLPVASTVKVPIRFRLSDKS